MVGVAHGTHPDTHPVNALDHWPQLGSTAHGPVFVRRRGARSRTIGSRHPLCPGGCMLGPRLPDYPPLGSLAIRRAPDTPPPPTPPPSTSSTASPPAPATRISPSASTATSDPSASREFPPAETSAYDPDHPPRTDFPRRSPRPPQRPGDAVPGPAGRKAPRGSPCAEMTRPSRP